MEGIVIAAFALPLILALRIATAIGPIGWINSLFVIAAFAVLAWRSPGKRGIIAMVASVIVWPAAAGISNAVSSPTDWAALWYPNLIQIMPSYTGAYNATLLLVVLGAAVGLAVIRCWAAAVINGILLISLLSLGSVRSLVPHGSGLYAPSKGNLGAIRSALMIYYGDMRGVYPLTLEALTTNGMYLSRIPEAAAFPHHAPTDRSEPYKSLPWKRGSKEPSRDTGAWGYVADPESEEFGTVFIDCTHADTKGNPWTHY
ncbi:hypothetical protein ACFL2T_05900 [Elusimicrobiota bacterium]